jgi:hypothetical protein
MKKKEDENMDSAEETLTLIDFDPSQKNTHA